jgi:hypothetical protein
MESRVAKDFKQLEEDVEMAGSEKILKNSRIKQWD